MRGQCTETVRRGCSNVGKIGKKPVGAPEERRPPILIPLDERRVAAHRQPIAVDPVRQMPPAATIMASLKPFSPSKAAACSTKAHVEASLSASRQATFVGATFHAFSSATRALLVSAASDAPAR